MPDTDDSPRAVVVLVVAGREIALAVVDRAARCDLELVDDLLRLQLAVARRGWSIRLRDVDRDIRELVELVGLAEYLGL